MSFSVLAGPAQLLSGWAPEIEGAMVRARARAALWGAALVLSTERGGPACVVAHLDRTGGPCQLLLRFPLRLISQATPEGTVGTEPLETLPVPDARGDQLPLFAGRVAA